MKKECLFYLHNTFENNHYALASFVSTMQTQGVCYSFIAKRFLDNRFSAIWKQMCCIEMKNLSLLDIAWQKYELLHAIYDGNPALAICMTAYMFNIPFVLSFHGGYDTNYKIFLPEMKEKIRYCVERSLYTTVVCKSDKESLLSLGCPDKKIIVTPPAIELSILPKSSELDNKRITVVGRFVEKKGIDVAIYALRLLDSGYTLDIIGDGEQSESLHHIATECELQDRIRWHGELPLEDTLKIIANNSFFWHPARRASNGNAEGIPQVLIFALALQRICIATNSGHIHDLIDNIDGAILVEANNPEELALTTLTMETKKELIDRSGFVEQYSVKNQMKNWLDIYDCS
ncbi:TPA: glycosyltransferase family 4 protein [Streptococcus suis]